MADPRRAVLKDETTDITGARVVIVEARFYDDLQDALLAGAKAQLDAVGVGYDVVSVPGCAGDPSRPLQLRSMLRNATAAITTARSR